MLATLTMRAPLVCLIAIEQETREQIVTEVVRAERQLEALLGQAALAAQARREARVVDEAVNRQVAREQLLRARADRVEVAEIELCELDVVVARQRA